MTFDEIMLQASRELGVAIDIHRFAHAFAQSKAGVPQDLFKNVPDEKAVLIMKGLIARDLLHLANVPKN